MKQDNQHQRAEKGWEQMSQILDKELPKKKKKDKKVFWLFCSIMLATLLLGWWAMTSTANGTYANNLQNPEPQNTLQNTERIANQITTETIQDRTTITTKSKNTNTIVATTTPIIIPTAIPTAIPSTIDQQHSRYQIKNSGLSNASNWEASKPKNHQPENSLSPVISEGLISKGLIQNQTESTTATDDLIAEIKNTEPKISQPPTSASWINNLASITILKSKLSQKNRFELLTQPSEVTLAKAAEKASIDCGIGLYGLYAPDLNTTGIGARIAIERSRKKWSYGLGLAANFYNQISLFINDSESVGPTSVQDDNTTNTAMEAVETAAPLNAIALMKLPESALPQYYFSGNLFLAYSMTPAIRLRPSIGLGRILSDLTIFEQRLDAPSPPTAGAASFDITKRTWLIESGLDIDMQLTKSFAIELGYRYRPQSLYTVMSTQLSDFHLGMKISL